MIAAPLDQRVVRGVVNRDIRTFPRMNSCFRSTVSHGLHRRSNCVSYNWAAFDKDLASTYRRAATPAFLELGVGIVEVTVDRLHVCLQRDELSLKTNQQKIKADKLFMRANPENQKACAHNIGALIRARH